MYSAGNSTPDDVIRRQRQIFEDEVTTTMSTWITNLETQIASDGLIGIVEVDIYKRRMGAAQEEAIRRFQANGWTVLKKNLPGRHLSPYSTARLLFSRAPSASSPTSDN